MFKLTPEERLFKQFVEQLFDDASNGKGVCDVCGLSVKQCAINYLSPTNGDFIEWCAAFETTPEMILQEAQRFGVWNNN